MIKIRKVHNYFISHLWVSQLCFSVYIHTHHIYIFFTFPGAVKGTIKGFMLGHPRLGRRASEKCWSMGVKIFTEVRRKLPIYISLTDSWMCVLRPCSQRPTPPSNLRVTSRDPGCSKCHYHEFKWPDLTQQSRWVGQPWGLYGPDTQMTVIQVLSLLLTENPCQWLN